MSVKSFRQTRIPCRSTNLLPSTTLKPASKSTREIPNRNAHSNSATFTPHSRLHRSLSGLRQGSQVVKPELYPECKYTNVRKQNLSIHFDVNPVQQPSRSHDSPSRYNNGQNSSKHKQLNNWVIHSP
ncbi:hypothetical protein KC19_5G069700 [Ceratodon purpureus]|uniref:Uncharacterized protein n=1 Tax=Ceratodon purpureus TaxID=3225 RepID=A0A8T0HZI2_CERPU|nr:hypothetical protein KC19_5G069700 [Ceratodon purpureus]